MFLLLVVFLLSGCGCVFGSDPNAHLKYRGEVYDLVFLEDPPASHVQKEAIRETIDGQVFECSVPSLEDKEEAQQQQQPTSSVSFDPVLALAPLKQTQCLYRIDSWWTYEFCFGASVKQFHQDHGSMQRTQEYVLGLFDKSVSTLTVEQDTNLATQRYVGGTKCDLTGEPRLVDVRFVCNERSDGTTFLGELQEPSTCKYLLTIVTPLACPKGGSSNAAKKTPTIYCNPQRTSE